MKKFTVGYHVDVGYYVTVEANSEEEAEEKAEFLFGEAEVVGKDAEYIDSALEYCEEEE